MNITKSHYLSYKQCAKRFWLQRYRPSLGGAQDSRRLKIGREIDERARAEFPHGVPIQLAKDPLHMISATQDAISIGAQTLFQATFSYEQMLCRVDILDKLPDGQGWHLIEVKSSSSYQKEKYHLADVAFQLYVLQQAGITIGKVSLMHLNKECTAPDLSNLFAYKELRPKLVIYKMK